MTVLAAYWGDVQLAAYWGTSLLASLSLKDWAIVAILLFAAGYGFEIRGRR